MHTIDRTDKSISKNIARQRWILAWSCMSADSDPVSLLQNQLLLVITRSCLTDGL